MRTRRFKKDRLPNRVFLVICEGETERAYVEALRHQYRLPITIKTKVSGNSINLRLLSRYLMELNLKEGDDFRIIFIYDADVHDIVEKLSQLPGKLILTNPCIELWYLLHTQDHTSNINSDSILKLLRSSHSAWTSYTKGQLSKGQIALLTGHYSDAIERSRKLNWPENPSSNIGDFIDMLNKEKIAEATRKSPSKC